MGVSVMQALFFTRILVYYKAEQTESAARIHAPDPVHIISVLNSNSVKQPVVQLIRSLCT